MRFLRRTLEGVFRLGGLLPNKTTGAGWIAILLGIASALEFIQVDNDIVMMVLGAIALFLREAVSKVEQPPAQISDLILGVLISEEWIQALDEDAARAILAERFPGADPTTITKDMILAWQPPEPQDRAKAAPNEAVAT